MREQFSRNIILFGYTWLQGATCNHQKQMNRSQSCICAVSQRFPCLLARGTKKQGLACRPSQQSANKDEQNELLKQCWHIMKLKPTAVWPCLCFPSFLLSELCRFLLFSLCESAALHPQLGEGMWLVRNHPLPWQGDWCVQVEKESSPLASSVHTPKLLGYTLHPSVALSRPRGFSVGVSELQIWAPNP